MNKFTIIPILILIMSSLAMAITFPEIPANAGLRCYVRVNEGGSCVRMDLPGSEANYDFCFSLNGQSVPGQDQYTFETGIGYSLEDSVVEPVGFSIEGCEPLTPAPEFGTIGAGIALVGSIGAYLKKKKAKKSA